MQNIEVVYAKTLLTTHFSDQKLVVVTNVNTNFQNKK